MENQATVRKTSKKKVQKKKVLDAKEHKFKIKDMISLLYRIKVVILAFVSGILFGLSIGLEQLQLVKLKSVMYGVFIFLLFDVSAYYIWRLINYFSKEKE